MFGILLNVDAPLDIVTSWCPIAAPTVGNLNEGYGPVIEEDKDSPSESINATGRNTESFGVNKTKT